MNRSSRPGRLTLAVTGAALAVVIAAAPVLAAPTAGAGSASGGPIQAETLTSRHRCAATWRLAAAEPTLEHWQAVGLCEVDRRLATIERLEGAVDDARALTDEHEAALERILADAAAGLRGLRAEIEAETILADLKADIRAVFSDFRIYVLVVRQVRLVTAADTVDAAGAGLAATAADLAVLIERAAAAGHDVTEATAHLEAMKAALAEALAGVEGVAADVLPLTPADWNDGTAGPILRAARQAILDAKADLLAAAADARAVIAALAG